jgi:hypothetical protein
MCRSSKRQVDVRPSAEHVAGGVEAIGFDDLDVLLEVADGPHEGEAEQRVVIDDADAGPAGRLPRSASQVRRPPPTG